VYVSDLSDKQLNLKYAVGKLNVYIHLSVHVYIVCVWNEIGYATKFATMSSTVFLVYPQGKLILKHVALFELSLNVT